MPSMNVGVAAYKWGKYATALREWRPLAAQGNAEAQYNLGLMYRKGLGVAQNYVRAYGWYNLAASTFPPGKDRDQSVKNRDIVAKKMTPAQISEAHTLAR